jgi:SAM-dependent methyltransferase
VLGIDLADRLLTLAQEKARQRALQNIIFRFADMLELDNPAASFDAVVCVFGICFVPNMPEAVRELWRLRPTGWKTCDHDLGTNVLQPANSGFWRSILELRPELHKAFNPWDRINEPEALRQMLRAGGVEADAVTAENRWRPIHSPEDWWTIVLGSGYRGTVEQITPTQLATVKKANVVFVRDH